MRQDSSRMKDEATTWAAKDMSRKTCSWVRLLSPGQITPLYPIPVITAADRSE